MNDQERYLAACHAMQSGVLWEMNQSDAHTPKHLRVGVNSAFIANAALTRLLIEKGVFTMEEYVRAQADEMEREVQRYELRSGMKFA